MKNIVITGGAGFAGSNLATLFRTHFPQSNIICFDNLKRRGSELSLARLRENKIAFVHGDVRIKEDLLELPKADLIIDCAAEPSVLAGVTGSPDYVIQTNLGGTLNCLELARRDNAAFIFLSTSRVYPVEPINSLSYDETPTRFTLSKNQQTPGASEHGISERFPLEGIRSLYGASKLSSELMVQEYAAAYGVKAIINRCGVLTGPWQMGKVDQGVVVLWAAKHIFGGALSYVGFNGSGKQVRDILHIRDLFALLVEQLKEVDSWSAEVFNVGGGTAGSVSLRELTDLCRDSSGNEIQILRSKESRPNDLVSYVTDSTKVMQRFKWQPRILPADIIREIVSWIQDNREALRPFLS